MAVKTKQELRDYTNAYINTNGVQAITGASLNVLEIDIIDTMATDSGLEVITEGETTGYALKDDNRSQKGDIGTNTVDLNRDASHPTPYIESLTYVKGGNFSPLNVAPLYDEGNFWYDNSKKTFAMHNEVTGVELNLGETWIRVINKTGVIIKNGSAVRNTGSDVATQLPTIELAISITFAEAYMVGLTTHEIGIDEVGYVTTNGDVVDIDTSALVEGGPVYLSDTIAGGLTSVAPSIASVIGICLISGATNGKIFVNVLNLLNFPGSVGILQQLTTPAISLTADVPQAITGYVNAWNITMEVDPINGTITLPVVSGFYRVGITVQISFTSESQTRALGVELYNNTLGASIFTYIYNVPRDATSSSFSFTYPFADDTDSHYLVRIASENTEIITFDKISFDIESSHLRQ